MRAIAMALLLALVQPAFAAEKAQPSGCALERYSSMPISTLSDGRIAIPVTVQGRNASFMVDTGGVSATMTMQLAKDIDKAPKPAARWLGGVGGSLLTTFIYADSFSIGRLTGKDLIVYIDPRINGMGIDGTLAPDMLGRFDVDIDFARGTLSLFSPSHCPGKVVYWTQGEHITVPMDVAPSGHIRVPVTVDGKTVMATLDTGSVISVMSMSLAKSIGVAENSPDLKLKRSYGINGRFKEYSYPFKTLALDGLTVTNPHIKLLSDEMLGGKLGSDLILGVGILRQLHLYISYKEEKIYITPALAN